MKKMIAAIAVAGLSAGFAAVANAQVLNPNNVSGTSSSGSYSVTLDEVTSSSTNVPGDFTYTYNVTSLANSTGGAIDTMDFSGILGFAGFAGSSNFGGGAPLISTDPTGTVTSLAYNNGVLANNSSFFFDSIYPPGGSVGIVGSGNAPGGTVNTGGSFVGPAVPESSSFALLGLGLLPLGFFVRRRMARQA